MLERLNSSRHKEVISLRNEMVTEDIRKTNLALTAAYGPRVCCDPLLTTHTIEAEMYDNLRLR